MNLIGILSDVRGIRDGIPKLKATLKVSSGFDERVQVLSVTGEIKIDGTQGAFSAGGAFLGYAVVEGSLNQFFGKGAEQSWTIALPVNQDILRTIEDIRQRKDFYLIGTFSFVATLHDSDGSIRCQAPYITDCINNNHGSGGNISARIPLSDWIAVLRDLGYGDPWLIEVPMKRAKARGTDRAQQHLDAAWQHFHSGQDNEVLMSCHKAFEYLAKKQHMASPDQNAFEKILSSASPDVRKHFKMLLHHLCQAHHLGRHEPGGETPCVGHAEAEFLLVTSQAALAYLASRWAV
jgi:hypothetical protein